MGIPFVKMQGAGNDYVYVDAAACPVPDPAALSRAVSRRRFGVGADGLVLVLPSERADFRVRVFNTDGSEAPICGNACIKVDPSGFFHGKWGIGGDLHGRRGSSERGSPPGRKEDQMSSCRGPRGA